jgi:hypothetical protein
MRSMPFSLSDLLRLPELCSNFSPSSSHHDTLNSIYRKAPPFEASVPWTSRLPPYRIPEELFDFLHKPQPKLVQDAGRKFLPQSLTLGTYVQMFQVLLWCEEYKISYVCQNGAV